MLEAEMRISCPECRSLFKVKYGYEYRGRRNEMKCPICKSRLYCGPKTMTVISVLMLGQIPHPPN